MSKAGWTSPDEPWDQHSRPQARAALDNARRAGWWLKKSSGSAKVWGVITCGDPSLPSGGPCSTSILSTSGSADGSATAQHINKVLRACTHHRGPSGPLDSLADAVRLLATASQCLQAARALIQIRAHGDLVEDYLAQSEAAADEADDLLVRALAEEALAERAAAAASNAAAAAGTSTSLGAAGLAERARDQAGEAREIVAGDTSRRARTLRSRCDDVRAQARALLAEIR